MVSALNPATETDRVRRYTSQEMLRRIEERTEKSISFHAAQPPQVIDRRIGELRREWSIERYLQVNASVVGFSTGFLALTSTRKWAVLTCAALGFFLYHALRGFDPPIPLLRQMGVRTRREIDREIYALKALRGDFSRVVVEQPKPTVPAKALLEAVTA